MQLSPFSVAGDEAIMNIAGHVSPAMLSRYSHVRGWRLNGGLSTRLPRATVRPMTCGAKKQSGWSRVQRPPFKQQWCNKLLLRKAQFSAGSVDCIAIPAVEIQPNARTSTIRRHACRMICAGNSGDAQYARSVFLAVRALQGKRASPNAYTDGIVDYKRRRLETETED